jgi:drug/metabolite transporter (DMT)-like permease
VIPPGYAVIVFGLLSAVAWGSGDFGGGLLSRRAPLFGVVIVTQLSGMIVALVLAAARSEPVPAGMDVVWAAGAGLSGVVGITSLYHALAVGRMGVVAPVTGVLAALVPVSVGIVSQGVPGTPVIAGIVVALLAVVLVTRAPTHDPGRPSGLGWALVAGLAIGSFNTFAGQLSAAGAFAPLVLIRLVQVAVLGLLVIVGRRAWRVDRGTAARLAGVGLLDMTGNAGFILAAQTGHLAVAAVLSSLYPVTTVLLAIVVLRERVSRSHVAGIALTAVAIALIGAGTATL